MIHFSSHGRFAIEVAKKSGEVIGDFHNRRMEQVWTGRRHFKTAADDASEAVIRKMIRESYPDHNIWSEEGGRFENGSRYTWVWDAVDGTIPMFTGISDHFAVCGALFDKDVPVVGVANAVGRGELYVGEIGKGAYCNEKLLRVSSETSISHVLMGVDAGKENRELLIPFLERMYQPDGIVCFFSGGCMSIPLLLVASGIMHAYLATSAEPEDLAAAVPIIREAGGKVTNLKGEEWKLGDVSILAANPDLHGKLSKFLKLF
ncbi:MAG: inositol monophosphatase [bacterium]|nr:inositol monophosphatase [bacterium]